MKKSLHILLIDDDVSLGRVLEHQLSEAGHTVDIVRDGSSGLALFEKKQFDVVVTDISMPGLGGLQVLQRIREKNDRVVIILITAYGTVENAINACDLGADDYLTKPFGIEQLLFAIEKAFHHHEVEQENVSLKAQLHTKFGLDAIVGQSAVMQIVYRMIQKVAPTDTTVLIQGESGTGKELVARAIHTLSKRNSKPFVPVDCAAIPDSLIESELFGHVKGAFTGAIKDRIGKFEAAEGGTLFLDEIGDLKEELQSKLLRVLQERTIEKVGDNRSVPVNVRIIAATNRSLEQAVKNDRFRQDLFYRLAVVEVDVPPLRERREDIPELVEHFMIKYAKEIPVAIEKEACQRLKSYDWPGNVRELENVIERAIVMADNHLIKPDDLSQKFNSKNISAESMNGQTLEAVEIKVIKQALEAAGGNQTRAAKKLDIPRHVLIYRIKKYQIS